MNLICQRNKDTTKDDVTYSGDTCLHDDHTVTQTADNVQLVTSISISRDGVDLATISQHSPMKQMAPGAIVTGHLTTGQAERAKLEITWPHPSQDEAGQYKCHIITFSAQGHADVFSQSLEITNT